MRWPPVSLISGTLCFSATSAIRRSCCTDVTPPFICGTTEKVPSRWMLACTRSLMNRASRSSMYWSASIIFIRDARPILDFASSALPGAERGEHRGHRAQALLADGCHQCRLVQRNPGHVVAGGGVLLHGAVRGPLHHLLHQQLAGTAALAGPGGVHGAGHGVAAALDRVHEGSFAERRCSCRPARRRRARPRPRSSAGPPTSNISEIRSSGRGSPLVEGLGQVGHLPAVAEQGGAHHLVVPDDDGLEHAAAGLGEHDVLVRLQFRALQAHGRDLDAGNLEFGGDPGAEVGRRWSPRR